MWKRPSRVVSEITDDDLRTAFRLRAAGIPRPGLRHRIQHSARSGQEPRTVAVLHGTASFRPILVRVTAIVGIATVLALAPLAAAEPGGWGSPGSEPQRPTPDQALAIHADADQVDNYEEGDYDDDEDIEDDEDDEDDEWDEDDEDDGGKAPEEPEEGN